jgi:heptose I phosphotransferase
VADSPGKNEFHVLPQYQPWMRQIGLDAEAVFEHPDIVAWRTLPDRENCTLDATVDGRAVRLHIKRYQPARAARTPAEVEADAWGTLFHGQIPTIPLVGWGRLADGRSFLITEDLGGYSDAEKLVRSGMPFERLLDSTAGLAGKLHGAGLHHRDLYLCHFFAREDDPSDVRLIDVARVRRLSGFFRGRWIVKDLAQFWYSTLALPVTDEQRARWLARYGATGGVEPTPRLRRAIHRKVRAIARHDQKLRQNQPTRNVSIPQ